MNKNSGALLRDIRNIKKNQVSMTTKNITSSKDIKKARSSEQINFHKFMDNKNETIKNIDEKLQVHQTQIQKNNGIISELTNNFTYLRNQFVREKQKVEMEEKKNRQLKEQLQRTSKLLKNKSFKVQDLTRKLTQSEKEVQNLKQLSSKIQELAKNNGSLRKINNNLEDGLSQKKSIIQEKDKENERLRERLKQNGNVSYENEKNKKQLLEKEEEIMNLKVYLTNSQNERKYLIQEKDKKEKELNELRSKVIDNHKKLAEKESQLKEFKVKQKMFKDKIYIIQKENVNFESTIKLKDTNQSVLRAELRNLKEKYDQVYESMRSKKDDQRQKKSKINNQDHIISDLKKKLSESEELTASFKENNTKVQLLKKRSKVLESLYNTVTPQIQCPFGHQLVNPVTIIPCGHNYCLGCKRGYTKECAQCNGKLKIEAVYRNQLMDDIIKIVGGIKQVVQIIK